MPAHTPKTARITEVLSVSISREPGDDIIKATLEVVLNAAIVVARSYRVSSTEVVIPIERLVGLTLLQAEAVVNGL